MPNGLRPQKKAVWEYRFLFQADKVAADAALSSFVAAHAAANPRSLPNWSLSAETATAARAGNVAGLPAAIAEIDGATVDVAVVGETRVAIPSIGVVGVPRAQAGTSRRVAAWWGRNRPTDDSPPRMLARLAHGD